jgi:hypothetical protein
MVKNGGAVGRVQSDGKCSMGKQGSNSYSTGEKSKIFLLKVFYLFSISVS